MAAGMMSTSAIQCQLLWNHTSFTKRFKAKTITIESNPHGNIKNVDGLDVGIGIQCLFE